MSEEVTQDTAQVVAQEPVPKDIPSAAQEIVDLQKKIELKFLREIEQQAYTSAAAEAVQIYSTFVDAVQVSTFIRS